MVDSIQSTSSIPLPDRITERTNRDPLPLDSTKEIAKSDDKRLKPSLEAKQDSFEDYLDQTSITQLEQQQQSNRFDPVAELKRNSIYSDPGKNNPI